MKQKKNINKILLLPSLSLGLLSLPLIDRGLYFIAAFALIPFIIFLRGCAKCSVKQISRAVYWPGFAYGLVVYMWELQTTPSSWTALQGNLALFGKIAAWLLSAFTVSIGFWIMSRFIVYFKANTRLLMFSIPVVWALSEVLRVYSFSYIMFGPGASLSPNWNLGLIGLNLMATPLGFTSRLFGIYGLSMVAVMFNIALLLLMSRKNYKSGLYMILILICTCVFSYVLYKPTGRHIRVSAVHLARADNLQRWPSDINLKPDTDILVLPEYSLFFDNKNYEDFSRKNLMPDTLVITSVSTNEKPDRNLLTAFQPNRGIISQQAKTFLVAGGEFMPYIFSVFFSAINQNNLTITFNQTQQIIRGARPEEPINSNKLRVGSLVCSGVLALNEYRRLAASGSQLLTNSASLSIISSASLYHNQESNLTRFHAVANARSFVQASRSGESYIINSNGDYLAVTKGETAIINGTVQTNDVKTIYTLLGEWTLFLGPFYLLLVWYRTRDGLLSTR